MKTEKLKIVFFGTPDFAIPALKTLIDTGHEISAVFAGQGPINNLAGESGLKVFQPASPKKDDRVFEEFKKLKPDVCIIAAYGKIIPERYLDIPKYGFINIHPSLLPKYRGPSPVQTAILNGDTETGASIIFVDKEVDHGPLLASASYKIDKTKYHIEVATDIFRLGAKLLIETLPKYVSGEIKPKAQDHSRATFTKMFGRKDGRIDWSQSAEKIYNQIRALNPEPGTWTTWKGKVINILNVTTLNVVSSQNGYLVPGTITRAGENIAVATKKCYLILKQIQLEGGKKMDAQSFLNGHPDFPNSKLE